jgi:hypothetical protein
MEKSKYIPQSLIVKQWSVRNAYEQLEICKEDKRTEEIRDTVSSNL